MADIVTELLVIFQQQGITEKDLITHCDVSKNTIHEVWTGRQHNIQTLTLEELIKPFDIRLTLETSTSRAAVDNSDISAYREMVARRDDQILKLESLLEKRDEQVDRMLAIIDNLSSPEK